MTENLRIASRDPLTRQPYPIYYNPAELGRNTNKHHGWHSKHRLKRELPRNWGRALRASRLYGVPIELHRNGLPIGYHRNVDEGPGFPEDIHDFAETIGFAAAGALPRVAIDTQSQPGVNVLKPLNDRQHRFLASPQRTFIDGANEQKGKRQAGRDAIGRFFAEYALREAFEHSALAPIEEELLMDFKRPLTKELGAMAYRSTMESLNELLNPVVANFKVLKSEGAADRRTDLRSTVTSFLPPDRFGSYYYAGRDAIFGESQYLQTEVNNVQLAA